MFSNHNQKLLSAYLHDSHNNNGFPSFYYILGQEEGKEGKNGRLLRGCLLWFKCKVIVAWTMMGTVELEGNEGI